MSIYRNACQVHLLNVILEQKHSFFLNVFNKWRWTFTGVIPSPCYLWVYLEECWRPTFISKICCICPSRNIYVLTFCKADGVLFHLFQLVLLSLLLSLSGIFYFFVEWLTSLSVLQSYVDTAHGSKPLQGNANQAWSCLDLLEVLCQLAERGHASAVRMMLENPLKHCPDVLLAGVSHINVSSYHLYFKFKSLILFCFTRHLLLNE